MLLLLRTHSVGSVLTELFPCPLAFLFLPLALVLNILHFSSLHIYFSWSSTFLLSSSVFVRSSLALRWKNLTENPMLFLSLVCDFPWSHVLFDQACLFPPRLARYVSFKLWATGMRVYMLRCGP